MLVSYLHRVFDQIIKEMCKRNNTNRKKQTIPHRGGSKANATRRAEMMIPHRGGSKANATRRAEMEKVELALSQRTIDESQISPNDVIGKAFIKEHSGRARCLGLGVFPSKVFKQVRPHFGCTSASNVRLTSKRPQSNYECSLSNDECFQGIYDNERRDYTRAICGVLCFFFDWFSTTA